MEVSAMDKAVILDAFNRKRPDFAEQLKYTLDIIRAEPIGTVRYMYYGRHGYGSAVSVDDLSPHIPYVEVRQNGAFTVPKFAPSTNAQRDM